MQIIDPQHPQEPWNIAGEATASVPGASMAHETDLRLQALQRLRYMSIQHAMHAWDRRYSDPIAPFGLAFLYAQSAAQPSWHNLNVATRLWLAGPEAVDLARLLFNLNTAVAQRANDPTFDIRSELANRVDPGMSDDAWYIGLGVTSLDTSRGSWKQVCRQVANHAEIPSVIRIVMIDSTLLLCDRHGAEQFNALSVRTTQPLSVSALDAPFPWSGVAAQDLHNDPEHATILRWMEELNLNLWRADNARLAMLRSRSSQQQPSQQQPRRSQG